MVTRAELLRRGIRKAKLQSWLRDQGNCEVVVKRPGKSTTWKLSATLRIPNDVLQWVKELVMSGTTFAQWEKMARRSIRGPTDGKAVELALLHLNGSFINVRTRWHRRTSIGHRPVTRYSSTTTSTTAGSPTVSASATATASRAASAIPTSHSLPSSTSTLSSSSSALSPSTNAPLTTTGSPLAAPTRAGLGTGEYGEGGDGNFNVDVGSAQQNALLGAQQDPTLQVQDRWHMVGEQQKIDFTKSFFYNI